MRRNEGNFFIIKKKKRKQKKEVMVLRTRLNRDPNFGLRVSFLYDIYASLGSKQFLIKMCTKNLT